MSDELVLFAYARQSLQRQGDKGDSVSVADQFRSIEDYAERLGGRVVRRFSDVDVSGGTESREGLDRLLDDVKAVRPHAVVIRDISRLARDTRIFLTLVDTLKRSNVELLSTTENLEDRTLTVVMSAFAERERLALAGRIAGGVREHARRGKMHGRCPFGYRRANGVMTIHEPDAAVVRRIYALYGSGVPTPIIAERLNADPAMPPSPSGGLWRRDVVAAMIRRRTYAGDVVIGARRDISGRLWPAVETCDAHPAIVERSVWEAANRRFGHRRHVVRETLVSPFSGMLICSHCGGRIYIFRHERSDRRPGQEPVERKIARCSHYAAALHDGARVSRPCSGHTGSRELSLVEPVCVAAVHALIARVATPEEIRRSAGELRAATRDDAPERARHRLVDIERRRARLLDAYETGALDLMTWTGRDRLLAADAEALSAIIAQELPPVDVERVVAMRDSLAALPPEGVDYRALLTELGGMVVFDLDELTARITIEGDYALLFGDGQT